MNSSTPDPLAQRRAFVQGVVQDVARRRGRGESVSDEEIIAAHSDLMPELREALRTLAAPDITLALPPGPSAPSPVDPRLRFAGRSAAHASSGAFDEPRPPIRAADEGGPSSAGGLTIAIPESARAGRAGAPSGETGVVPAEVRFLIPGYEILQEISRGGQGVVYLALEQAAKRRVAIKLLLSGPHASSAMRRRFEREIELAAQLKHPNIISVFHSGQTRDGRQFYVMDYVEGVPLDRYVRERQLALEPTLSLMIEVCEGVQYAHQRGMIHRDLKPGNVLVEEEAAQGHAGDGGTRQDVRKQGQATAQPRPRILDFGLAKQVDAACEPGVSISHEVVGTLPFMSPEQATGRHDAVDIRTDVYALGVMLYVLLTGDYPYPVVGSLMDVVQNITDTSPMPPIRKWHASPTGLRKKVSKACPFDEDVQTIVLKALAKEPERRYQSAGELARDLRRYLAGEPIEARADSNWYVFRKTLRRYRFSVSVAAAFVLLVTASAVALLLMYREQGALLTEVQEQKNRAVAAQRQAEESGRKEMIARQQADDRALEAQRQAYLASIGAADAALRSGDVGAARLRLQRSPQTLRGWEWRHLMAQIDRSTATRSDHQAPVTGVAFASDGARFASADQSGVVLMHSLEAARPSDAWRHDQPALCVRFSPDDLHVATGLGDGTITIRDAASSSVLRNLAGHGGDVLSLAYSPDGALLASGSKDGTVRLWRTDSGDEAGVLTGHAGWVSAVEFTTNGQRLLSASWDGTIRVWDVALRKEERTYTGHPQRINALAVSRYGDMVASASWGMVKVWIASNGRDQNTLRLPGGDVLSVAISPDGTRVAAGMADGSLRLLDTATGFEIAVLRGHLDAVGAVAFSPDFSWIASASADRTVKLWDAGQAERGSTPVQFDGPITAAAATPDGAILAIANMRPTPKRGSFILFDARSGKAIRQVEAHAGEITTMSFSPDGGTLLTGGFDKQVRFWNVAALTAQPAEPNEASAESATAREEPAPSAEVPVDAPPMTALFAPQAGRCAIGLARDEAIVLDARDGNILFRLAGHGDAVSSICFAPDGKTIATSCWDGLIRVYAATDGSLLLKFDAAPEAPQPSAARQLHAVTYSADGGQLISGGSAGRIDWWSAASGEPIGGVTAGRADVAMLALAPRGGPLAAALQNGAVALVDATTREALLTLRGHERPVIGIGFVADGERLLTASTDGVFRAWDAPR